MINTMLSKFLGYLEYFRLSTLFLNNLIPAKPVQAVVIIEVKRNSRLIREDLPSHDSN